MGWYVALIFALILLVAYRGEVKSAVEWAVSLFRKSG
jgi:hypothetical protein